ncbi:MAG: hypothetical protein J2P13_03845 [Acidobacteria bacterium]|nr:hypothetical protein [Acidobacteriota bacterium]
MKDGASPRCVKEGAQPHCQGNSRSQLTDSACVTKPISLERKRGRLRVRNSLHHRRLSLSPTNLVDKAPADCRRPREAQDSSSDAVLLGLFDQYRSLLFSVAYRMLGSVADAEDMVQETFIRWQQANSDDVYSPRAFLVAILRGGRECIFGALFFFLLFPWDGDPRTAESGP